MIAVLLALAASASWGGGDFLGGLASRRVHMLAVLFVSQCAALAVLSLIVLVTGVGIPADIGFLAFAAAAGITEGIGLAAFYRGLAVGAMGIVSPISASAATVPIAVGLLRGELPSTLAVLGIVLALSGTVIVALQPRGVDAQKRVAVGVGLALLAALGFGWFFVLMDEAVQRGAVLSAVFVNRVTLVLLAGIAVLVMRPAVRLPGSRLRSMVIGAGILDVSGSMLYGLATTVGLLIIVGMLGALYPVITLVLAWIFLQERLHPLQRTGAGIALSGVVLIGVGA